MKKYLQDLKSGIRSILKHANYSMIAILTMTLGIAVTTTMFSLINQVIIQPLPLPQSDQLISVQLRSSATGEEVLAGESIQYPIFDAWSTLPGSELELGFLVVDSSVLTETEIPVYSPVLYVSPNFLSMLGVQPLMGRWFNEEEAGQDAIVITHDMWIEDLSSDPNIVGKAIAIDKKPHTVLGVMPEDFAKFIEPRARYWKSINTFGRGGQVYGRFQGGLSEQERQQQSLALNRILQQASPALQVEFVPMKNQIIESMESNLWLLMVAVSALLIVALLNVTNLAFAYFNDRVQELSTRVSLGATRNRLIRQLVIENLLLALVAGLASILLAAWLLDIALLMIPGSLPRRDEIGIDIWVWLFSIGLASLCGLATAIAPSMRIANPEKLINFIKQGSSRYAGSHGNNKLRKGLIAVQVGFALILLITVGLLLQSYMDVLDEETGFSSAQIVTGHIWAPDSYNQDEQKRYFRAVLEEIKTLPEVTMAAATSALPMGPISTRIDPTVVYTYPGQPDLETGLEARVSARTVTDDYFEVLEVPLLEGRYFDEREAVPNTNGIIVNQMLANIVSPGESALDKQITVPAFGNTVYRIVGVVANSKFAGLDAEIKPEFFISLSRSSLGGSTYIAKVRSADLDQALQSISRASLRVDNSIPMIELHRMDDLVLATISKQKSILWFLFGFAVMTIALAGVGIYGLSNYLIGQRTTEIAVRMALGAKPANIRNYVLKDAITPMIFGVFVGFITTILLVRVLTTFLFGIQPWNLVVYTSATAIVLAVGLMSSVGPALKAAKIRPNRALHYQ